MHLLSRDGAVEASDLIANELDQASKPFSDGELVKICTMMAVEVVCPEKQPAFSNISMSRNTVVGRVEGLSRNIGSQIQDKIKSFITFSVAICESADVTITAQLCVFIRGVEESFTVTDEFLELVTMKDTTRACDIFCSLVTALDKTGVNWSRAVSLAAECASLIVGRNEGVATKFRENVLAANGGLDFFNFHCILHQEALSCEKLKMDHVMSVVVQTVNFIRARGLNHR